tara:strand:+ start:1274 stop:2182 length:909 start_codon:yes stop_codon:yes gene_type:complete
MFGNQAPQTYLKTSFNSESKSITASTQQFDSKKVNVYGHISSLLLKFSVTITKGTGTINTAKSALSAVGQIVIRDKNSRPILDEDASRLPIIRKILSLSDSPQWQTFKKGEYDAPTSLVDVATAQTFEMEVPIDVNLEDQPISIEWSANALSSVLSTVGTATATCQLECAVTSIVPIGESANLATRETRRIYSFTRGAIATEQEIQGSLPTGVTIDNISLGVTTDSNLTDVTLKATGKNIGLDRVNASILKQKENRGFFDGHTTGYFTLFTAPFVVGDSTLFKINPSTSFNPRIFICHRGVR